MTHASPFSLKQLRSFLRSPWALLFALTIGIVVGVQSPELGRRLDPIGQLYLSLLKMCVLPILISGIVLSISFLVSRSNYKIYLVGILQTFAATMAVVSFSGFFMTSIFGPGRYLDTGTLQKLGILILDKSALDLEISLLKPIVSLPSPDPLATFVLEIVPENIFEALSSGNVLQVLCAALLFGVSLGVSYRKQQVSDPVFELLDNIYHSFGKLIDWLILFLPLGLLSLIASQVADTGLDALRLMSKFVFSSSIVFVMLFLVGSLAMAQATDRSLYGVIKAFQEASLVTLATSNALASIPIATNTLTRTFRCDLQASNIILPLSIMVGRFGQVSYFTMASVFVVQLYEKPLTVQGVATILLGSVLAGIASSGSTSIATLSTLTFVLTPLNLPLESVLILLIAVDPLLNPLRSLCTLNLSIAATLIVARSLPPQPIDPPESPDTVDSDLTPLAP